MLRKLIQSLETIDKLASPSSTRAMEPWTYQRVQEGAFGFDRIWLDTAKGRRISLHTHERGLGKLFWHPHPRLIAVIAVGQCEVFFGAPNTEKYVMASRVRVNGVLGYELPNDAWHGVRTYAATDSIMMFGNSTDDLDEEPLEIDYTQAVHIAGKIRACVERVKTAQRSY